MKAGIATALLALVLAASAWAADDDAEQAKAVAKQPAPGQARAGEHEALEPAVAMDSLELDTTDVTGNRELPKVMVIVPWRKADPGDLDGRPVNSLIEEVLAPLDREEFLRQVDYYSDLVDSESGEDFDDGR